MTFNATLAIAAGAHFASATGLPPPDDALAPTPPSASNSAADAVVGLYSVGESATIILFLGLVTVVSIGGNALVCVAILSDRRLRKVSNLFLVSLAIADLVVSCLVMPFAIANDVLGYWPFDERFCTRWLSLDVLSATASILNLCAISLDRFVHMKNPFVYEQWMTTRRCLLFIGLTWLASLLISFLPLELGWHIDHAAAAEASESVGDNATDSTLSPLSSHNASATLAAEQYSSSYVEGAAAAAAAAAGAPHATCALQISPMYAIVSSSVSFYIPCIVMLGIYGQVYKLARHHAESIKRTQAYEGALTGGGGGGALRKTIQENKALFTLGIIMGLFLISWFPFFILNVVQAFCQCAPGEMMQAFIWLGYFNSTQNPIIYSIFNLDFREAFKRILTCERFRKKDPYGDLGRRGKRGSGGGSGHSNGASRAPSRSATRDGPELRQPLHPAAAAADADRAVVKNGSGARGAGGAGAAGGAGGGAAAGDRATAESGHEHIAMTDLRSAAGANHQRRDPDGVGGCATRANGDTEHLLNGHGGSHVAALAS